MAKTISAELRESLLDLEDGMADRIREASDASGISNRQIAHSMDVAERTVQDWKNNGQVARKNIPLLAHVLDCSISWLMTGEEEQYGRLVDSDDNVVKLATPVKGGPMGDTEVTYTHVPVVEVVEIQDLVHTNPKNWHNMAKNWIKTHDRGAMVIPIYDEDPGLPVFAIQCMTHWFQPHILEGAFMAYATDIVPTIGDFACFLIKKPGTKYWSFAAGFWEPTNWRTNTFGLARSFSEVTEFTLRMQPDSNSSTDLRLTVDNNEWEYLGTCVYVSSWKTKDAMRRHTGYLNRANEIANSRVYVRD